MKLRLYQVDAFTSNIFGGNPAAVCPLGNWLEDDLMQKIANENNLSETAFFVEENNIFHIRWFTPTSEVDLCGHATLASAYVIFNKMKYPGDAIGFKSKSGMLTVTINGEYISLNFPARNPKPIEPSSTLLNALTVNPKSVLFDKTTICVLETEKQVKNLKPNIEEFLNINTHGVIVTAVGDEVDFVSRFFAPDVGIDEDPVTGYAHTLLIPYWSKKLNKQKLSARQISERGGELECEYLGERVNISGKVVLYLEGDIFI